MKSRSISYTLHNLLGSCVVKSCNALYLSSQETPRPHKLLRRQSRRRRHARRVVCDDIQRQR